jgi:hypothetical protein
MISERTRAALAELKTYHATMLVTRAEEWCARDKAFLRTVYIQSKSPLPYRGRGGFGFKLTFATSEGKVA